MNSRFRGLVVVGAMMLAATVAASAADRTYRSYIDAPIVFGNQVFSGGEVTLVPVGNSSQLTAVRIDGRQVALLFSESAVRRSDIARIATGLVIRTDQRGFVRLVGLSFESIDRGTTVRRLRLASVAGGQPLDSDVSPQDGTASAQTN